jgi:hypothetical protein
MSTEKQINANRQNAQKSTGPKTDEGKAAVSQNAVKHGLFAESVIKGENEADYEVFFTKMFAELAPVGVVESVLAERAVGLAWRLKRAERIQNQAIDVMIARDEPSPLSKRLHNSLPKDLQEIDYDTRGAGPELVLGRSIIKDYSYSRVLDRLILYERRIESSLHKTLRELERRQLIRQYQQQEAEQELEPGQAIHIPINDDRDVAATKEQEKQGDLKKQNRFRLSPNTAGGLITDLKKQTQFSEDHISANSLEKGDYDNNSANSNDENKANLSLRERIQFRNQAALNAGRNVHCSSDS